MSQALLWVGEAKPLSSRNSHERQSQPATWAVNSVNKCPSAWDSPSWRLLSGAMTSDRALQQSGGGVLFEAGWSGEFSQRRQFGVRSLSVRTEPSNCGCMAWVRLSHVRTLLKHVSQISGNVETSLMWAQPFFFFSGDDLNNTPWSAEFVTITKWENAMLKEPSAQNEMMWSFLQRIKSDLDSLEGGALSHKWARIPWRISSVKALLCGLTYFWSGYYVWKHFKVNLSFHYGD